MKMCWREWALAAAMLCVLQGTAAAEGFGMNEWGARGLSLAGGMVGRADDPSALAYNAAGITQLPGTHLMAGGSVVAPYGSIEGMLHDGTVRDMQTKPQGWMPAHFYLTHQLNDNVWLGLGGFTRYGLGLSYSGQWMGRYDVYDLALQSMSIVPTVAFKVNDWLSLSVGGELLYCSLYMGKKNQNPVDALTHTGDIDSQVEAHGYGGGYQLGLHAKINDQWSVGLAYKSQVSLTMYGDIDFGNVPRLPAPYNTKFASLRKSDAEGTVVTPDSLALGVSYKPLDNLSFEVGTVWTRWSTYDHLNMSFDTPYGAESKSRKDFQDGWNFNASVEWKPYDWWALRAGAYYETPVVNEDHADFMMPTYGRTGLTLGTGFMWNDFTLDLAYAHLMINSLDYDSTDNHGVTSTLATAKAEDCVANIYSVSLSYAF